MDRQPAPYPRDDFHAAAPEAATHIDALHDELQSESPDRARIDEHVDTLRTHGGLRERLEAWYLDERTQAFIGELNSLGL